MPPGSILDLLYFIYIPSLSDHLVCNTIWVMTTPKFIRGFFLEYWTHISNYLFVISTQMYNSHLRFDTYKTQFLISRFLPLPSLLLPTFLPITIKGTTIYLFVQATLKLMSQTWLLSFHPILWQVLSALSSTCSIQLLSTTSTAITVAQTTIIFPRIIAG